MDQPAYAITEADKSILLALGRFHYLTAAQASRLLYPNLNDDHRYMQRRLKSLVDHDYVLRLRALPMPRYGQAPHVFTLGRKGRTYLQKSGFPVEPYFRPSEERRATENSPFMKHRLAAIDVMIAADLLCAQNPSITCPRMFSERELKRNALRVQVRSFATGQVRDVAVIPDACSSLQWKVGIRTRLHLSLIGEPRIRKSGGTKLPPTSHGQQVRTCRPLRPTTSPFAVVCSDHRRVSQLIDWTMRELIARRSEKDAELFLFTAVSPVTTPAETFFSDHIWIQADTGEAVSLLDFPMPTSESGVVFQAA